MNNAERSDGGVSEPDALRRLQEGDLKGLAVERRLSLTFVTAPSRSSEDVSSGLQHANASVQRLGRVL